MSKCSARQLFWTEDFKLPLPVHWFDGILNAGSYHASSSNTWKNIGSAGSGFDAKRNQDQASTKDLWAENAAMFTSRTNIYQPFFVGDGSDSAFRLLGEECYTIGCTFAVEQGWRTNYSGILGAHKSWNNSRDVGLNVGQYTNGDFGGGILYNDGDSQDFTISGGASIFVNSQIYNIIISISSTRRAMYIDGSLHSATESYREPSKYLLRGNPFEIGSAWLAQTDYSTDRTFVGKIFDVYAWDKEMSDKEIKSISNYSLQRFKQ